MRKLFRFRTSGAGVQTEGDSFLISSEARACQHSEGIVLLNLRKGTVFTSNRAGSTIWTGLEKGENVPAIAARLVSEFGIEAEQAARDAADFCSHLVAQGFLTREAA
jgi:hypothetical protein